MTKRLLLNDNGTTVEKEFTVTVKKLTISERAHVVHGAGETYTVKEIYTFDGDTITCEQDSTNDSTGVVTKSGYRYAVSEVTVSARTFMARRTHIRLNDGRFLEIGSDEYRQRAEADGTIKAVELYKKLAEKPVISLQDIRDAFAGLIAFPSEEAELFTGKP